MCLSCLFFDTYSITRWAEAAYIYCHPKGELKKFLQKAVKVLVKHKGQMDLRRWIEGGHSPTVLAERINNGEPLSCPPLLPIIS